MAHPVTKMVIKIFSFLCLMTSSIYGTPATAAAASKPEVDVKTVAAAKSQVQPFADRLLFIVLDNRESMATQPAASTLESLLGQGCSLVLTSRHSLELLLKEKKLSLADVTDNFVVRQTESPHLLLLQSRKSKNQITMPEADLKKSMPASTVEPKDYFLPAFKKMFVANKPTPTWAFFMFGHGQAKSIVAGLPLDQFKELLSFFETKIPTTLLGYISCYAVGSNTQIIYGDEKAAIGKSYKFPILTNGIVEDATSMKPSAYYAKAEKHITEPFDQEDNFLDVIATDFFGSAATHNRLTQVRLPGQQWFQVRDVKALTVSISPLMAQHRADPLDIGQTLGIPAKMKSKDYKVANPLVLLYADTVPFVLRMSIPNLIPVLIPMSQNKTYNLKAIELTNVGLIEYWTAVKDNQIGIEPRTFMVTTFTTTINAKKEEYQDVTVKMFRDATSPWNMEMSVMQAGKHYKLGANGLEPLNPHAAPDPDAA